MKRVALVLFIQLHNVDGSPVDVSPESIVSMRGRHQGQLFTEGARCLLNLVDGKYVVVRETCEEVAALVKRSEGQ